MKDKKAMVTRCGKDEVMEKTSHWLIGFSLVERVGS